jgi:hypothetical protein
MPAAGKENNEPNTTGVYVRYQVRQQVYRTFAGRGASAGIPCSLSVFCVVDDDAMWQILTCVASEKTDCGVLPQ